MGRNWDLWKYNANIQDCFLLQSCQQNNNNNKKTLLPMFSIEIALSRRILSRAVMFPCLIFFILFSGKMTSWINTGPGTCYTLYWNPPPKKKNNTSKSKNHSYYFNDQPQSIKSTSSLHQHAHTQCAWMVVLSVFRCVSMDGDHFQKWC